MRHLIFITLCLSTVVTHSAAIEQHQKAKDARYSLIERAAINQKHSDIDDIKMLTTIHVKPTQTFFAQQQEQFSRFLQNLFFSHES